MVGRAGLAGTGALLLASILLRNGLLFIVGLTLLLAALIAWLWERTCLTGVEYRRELSQRRAFFGEEIELTIEIVNRKLLPVTGLVVKETVPAALDWGDAVLRGQERSRERILERTASIGWYEAVRWRYQIGCRERGVFAIGPTILDAGDPFGFAREQIEVADATELVVYPRLLPLTDLGLAARRPFGDLRTPRALFTDPARTVGARDYQRDDPFKTIHWAATARQGRLQARVYEPATSLDLLIFLDLGASACSGPARDVARAERAISAAASVAQEGIRARYGVGLIANAMQARRPGIIRIPAGRSPTQLEHIFDALARVVPYALLPMASLLHDEVARLPLGATVLVISVETSDELRAGLLHLRRHGHPAIWLHLGADAPSPLHGVEIRHIPPPSAFQPSDDRMHAAVMGSRG
jgi:uncharacterized protein (DUF58 family)